MYPNFANEEKRDNYDGIQFHSARWDHSIDLTNKTVAVIGNGASAAQFVPAIQPKCKKLRVY
jgi:cation diffusion facilitator CzcD-associated flavoprotein CzcO